MTDQDLLHEIQYMLMETPIDAVTFASGLWTYDEVVRRMNERQNRFLKATQLLLGSADLAAPAHQYVYTLPQDWLLTMSLVWVGANGRLVELVRADSFETDHALPTWATDAAEPLVYMDADSPLLTVQIAPAPAIAGRLLLLYVPQGATLGLDPVNTPEPLGVPDEFAADVCKYGTLADLFGKDGRGKSPERAAYCEQRYRLAQDVAEILLNGRV